MQTLVAADVDAAIHGLAARQYGIVARQQLIAAGVPVYAIDNRVRNRRLESLYRGVYRTGPVRGRFERESAAVLASGDGAVLSHLSMAALLGLMPPASSGSAVEVSTPGRHPDPGKGVRIHRIKRLDADEVTRRHGVPGTTPARTLLDLAAVLSPRELERIIARSDRDGLATPGAVGRLVERYPRRAGTRLLRSILGRDGGPALTRSEAERLLLGIIRSARLPQPETNARVAGFEVDFIWRPQRLIVEVDGYTHHSSRAMFEGDRKRDRILTVAGYDVLRFTVRDLTENRDAALAQLAQALVSRSRGT